MIAVDFADSASLEALLRASVLFKFECPQESHMFAGSPAYAEGVNRLLAAIISEHRQSGREAIANSWATTYLLANHPERLAFVKNYAQGLGKWASLDMSQRRDWVDVVAAPYKIREEEYEGLVN
ncbi:hypothetical protein ACFYV7_35690 [Nocardia suismassiliense]|uniref:Uncharacterized protein n=1 Tax=Nocardia suismassiliense TaxID=2077092 RepID=A0ABW6R610_9NOCA